MKKRKFSEPEPFAPIQNTLELIYKGKQLSSSSAEKAILLFGNSGVGKTTVAYVLTNYKLIFTQSNNKWSIVGNNKSKELIGNSKFLPNTMTLNKFFLPTTTIPNKFPITNDIVVWEFPAINTKLGISNQIAQKLYINTLVNQHKGTKFVLVTHYAELLTSNGSIFINTVKKFCDIFKDIDVVKDSVSLVITHIQVGTKLSELKNCFAHLKLTKTVKTYLEEQSKNYVNDVIKMIGYLKSNILWLNCFDENQTTYAYNFHRIHDSTSYAYINQDAIQYDFSKKVLEYLARFKFSGNLNLAKIANSISPEVVELKSYKDFLTILIKNGPVEFSKNAIFCKKFIAQSCSKDHS